MKRPDTLVVMRLIDMRRTHPAQVAMTCASCGEKVGVYPTGQKALSRYPNLKLLCVRCAIKMEGLSSAEHLPAGPAKDIIAEMRASQPVKKA